MQEINKELNGIQESCTGVYDGFLNKYKTGKQGNITDIYFDEEVFNEYIEGVCLQVFRNLKKINLLRNEAEQGKNFALGAGNNNLLLEANRRISEATRLYDYWKTLTKESFNIMEKESRLKGYQIKVEVRMEPDSIDGCFFEDKSNDSILRL